MEIKLKWMQAGQDNLFVIDKRQFAIPTRSRFPHPIKKLLVDEQNSIVAASIGTSVEIGNYVDPILSYAIVKFEGDLIKVLYALKKQDEKDGSILIEVDEERSVFPKKYYRDMEYSEKVKAVVSAVLPELYSRYKDRFKNSFVVFGGAK